MRTNAVALIGLALLLAGCTSTVSGDPAPSGSASGAPSSDGAVGVPTVANPIDTSRFETDPCSALTSDQLAQLSITTQPKPIPGDKLGPGCQWNAYDEVGLTVGARLLTSGSSLAKLYKQHEQGQWPLFKPVSDISGYPGVLLDDLDAEPKGKCGLSVAVRDDLVYSVQVTISSDTKDYADPCPVAQKAAELAVSTMKAG